MIGVKPGRGPSLMGAIGGVVGAVIGVAWTMGALSMGAPPFFVLFGMAFVFFAIAGAVYNAVNAASRNRMSSIDITTDDEEGDPVADLFGHGKRRASESAKPVSREGEAKSPRQFEGEYCPYCRARIRADFDYCPKCGKDV